MDRELSDRLDNAYVQGLADGRAEVAGELEVLKRYIKDLQINSPAQAVIDENARLTAWALEERDKVHKLRGQLPEGMADCTILFKECARGHGRLTAANWVDHGCPYCEVERISAAAEVVVKAALDVWGERGAGAKQ